MKVTLRDVAFAAYCVVGMASLATMTLYMVSPEFRDWLQVHSKEYSYKLAVWNWNRTHKPIPEWVNRIKSPILPDED